MVLRLCLTFILVEILCSSVSALVHSVTIHVTQRPAVLPDNENGSTSVDIATEAACLRNAFKIFVFLMARFADLASSDTATLPAVPSDPASSRRRGGTGTARRRAAISDGSAGPEVDPWDWGEESSRMLDTVSDAFDSPQLACLWAPVARAGRAPPSPAGGRGDDEADPAGGDGASDMSWDEDSPGCSEGEVGATSEGNAEERPTGTVRRRGGRRRHAGHRDGGRGAAEGQTEEGKDATHEGVDAETLLRGLQVALGPMQSAALMKKKKVGGRRKV